MPYPKSWSAKDLRQYRHVKASTGGNKGEAAAVVNAFKNRQKAKKKKKK